MLERYKDGEFDGSTNLEGDLFYTIETNPVFREHRNEQICANDILHAFLYLYNFYKDTGDAG
jgi:hypothetical protein